MAHIRKELILGLTHLLNLYRLFSGLVILILKQPVLEPYHYINDNTHGYYGYKGIVQAHL